MLAATPFPLVAFLLLGGVWADRLPRHKVMIVTDLARFVLHAVLAALIFTDAIEIWHIVVIEALFGTAEAFFRPAYTGLVPQTVPEDRIQDAKAATGALETVAEFAGPALATAAGARRSAPAGRSPSTRATFLVLRGLPGPRPRAPRGGEAVRPRCGWRPSCATAGSRCASARGCGRSLLCFCGGGAARRSRRGSRSARPWRSSTTAAPASSALLVAAMGAGTIVGALTGFGWRPLHPLRMGMLLVLPVARVGSRLVALGAPLGVRASPRSCSAGFGLALFGVWWDTALAERVPPHLLSRVSAYDWLVSLEPAAGRLRCWPGRWARRSARAWCWPRVRRSPRSRSPAGCWYARPGRCGGSSEPPQRERGSADDPRRIDAGVAQRLCARVGEAGAAVVRGRGLAELRGESCGQGGQAAARIGGRGELEGRGHRGTSKGLRTAGADAGRR